MASAGLPASLAESLTFPIQGRNAPRCRRARDAVTPRRCYRSSAVSTPRELRSLVPFEVVSVLAIAAAPLPETVPVGLPLVIAATISMWVRRRGWAERASGGLTHLVIGLIAGVVAIAVAAPAYRAFGVSAVEWWLVPATREVGPQLGIAFVLVVATSIACELALRGWIVERMLELSPGPATLPILTGAIAEALVTPGPPGARLGALAFGLGLGMLYVGGGRSVIAPIAARCAFTAGAVGLEALRLVG